MKKKIIIVALLMVLTSHRTTYSQDFAPDPFPLPEVELSAEEGLLRAFLETGKFIGFVECNEGFDALIKFQPVVGAYWEDEIKTYEQNVNDVHNKLNGDSETRSHFKYVWADKIFKNTSAEHIPDCKRFCAPFIKQLVKKTAVEDEVDLFLSKLIYIKNETKERVNIYVLNEDKQYSHKLSLKAGMSAKLSLPNFELYLLSDPSRPVLSQWQSLIMMSSGDNPQPIVRLAATMEIAKNQLKEFSMLRFVHVGGAYRIERLWILGLWLTQYGLFQ